MASSSRSTDPVSTSYAMEDSKQAAERLEHIDDDEPNSLDELRPESSRDSNPAQYKVYRRRWYGLIQLVLLNVMVSWNWLTYAAVSSTAAEYYRVSESAINWLSTAFLFAFVTISPVVLWTLNKGGPKTSIVVSSALILVGNWIRYAGTRAAGSHFGVVMFGQICIGLAQPFVLSAPTRYSNLWFSDDGRVSATAVASLANALGGALGQLIGPFWATKASEIPNLVLYTALLSTVAALPAPFIPRAPPSPPSAIAAAEKLDISGALRSLPKNGSFFLLLIPFSIYVGFFNATSSLLNQIFEPYGFSETDAGIAGGILIICGLIAAAIISPIVDRYKTYLLVIKTMVPMIATAYLILVFIPATRSIASAYIMCAVLGAASFALLPSVLEYLVLVTHPASPEISSTICWTGGQLLGAVFIIVMDALRGRGLSVSDQPAQSMKSALVFQAVIAWMAVPFVFFLGVGRFQKADLRLIGRS